MRIHFHTPPKERLCPEPPVLFSTAKNNLIHPAISIIIKGAVLVPKRAGAGGNDAGKQRYIVY
jgi:hypothetical protein